MLSEDIRNAVEEEGPIVDKVYEDEVIVGIHGRKAEFDTVRFLRCRFEECDFTGAFFCNTTFEKCDLSNSGFRDTYWKNAAVRDSKADGSQFINSTFKWVKLEDSHLHYANFSSAFWEFGEIRNCQDRKSVV